ncbi:MAG: PAS domain S-box protein [Cyanobacteria bacterium SZAS TMP-1]|nr:PAS domain S-box protein [Cyanobacteria bacterium SZAS TMP-1]
MVLCALAVLLIVLGLVGYVTVRQQFWMILNRNAVMASYELSVQLDRLFILLQDAENAEQAFLLSGKESCLEPFEAALRELDPTFERLIKQSKDRPGTLQRLQMLRSYYDQEVTRLRQLVDERRRRGAPLPSPLAMNVSSDQVRENIRTLPHDLKEEERLFRIGASQNLLRQTETSNSELMWLVAIALLAVGGSASYAIAQLRAKDRALAMVRQVAHETVLTQEKLSAVLSSMDEGLCLLDKDGNIDYINHAGEILLGHPLGDVIGSGMHRLLHGSCESADCALLNFAASINSERDDLFTCSDGSSLPVHYILSPLVTNASVSGAVLTFIDISERKLHEMRLKAQQEVTAILAEGADLDQSVNKILILLCNYFDWQLGTLWLVEDNVLRCRSVVRADAQEFSRFDLLSRERAFPLGEGLPGLVWSTRGPAWVVDVAKETDFTRLPAAEAEDIHGAFALPIMAGNDFVGVLEFFSRAARERDDDQVATFTAICSQVGQFIQRLKTYDLLAQSEARYSLAVDGSMDGIWDWNIDTGDVFLSPRWKELLGYGVDEVNLNHAEFFELIHDDDKGLVRQALDDHISGRTPVYSANFRIRNKAGEYRWFSGRGRAVRDADGKALRMAGSNRDITSEREAAEKLRRSEQKFRAIFDTTFEFIGLLSPDGTLLDANRSALNFVGAKRDDVVGKLFWEGPWFYEEDRERLMMAVKNAASGRFDRFELDHTNESGTITVDFSMQPVFDGDGEVVYLIPEGRDITVLKETTARLKESEGLFRQLAENIREIFWIATPDSSKFFYVSPAYEEITGRSIEGIDENPKSFFDVLEPEDRKKAFRDFDEFVRSKDVREGEYRVIRPDGEVRWLAAKVFPIHDEDGQLVRICGVARDINDRKEAERRVSEFYSTVSHELRSPLTSIRGSLGLIEGGIVGEVSDKVLTFVTIARTESDRLIRLINNILDLRKIEAGKLELKIEDVSAQELVDSVLVALQGMAAEKQIELEVPERLEQNVPVDKDLISQVLTNLISNAIKFSPSCAKVTIYMSASKSGFVRFAVEDHGPGIPAAQAHKLFGKFQQLDSSDTRSQGGTGLGLAISKAIVEQHGGVIGFESTEGEGATFWFKLPLQDREGAGLPKALIFSTEGALSSRLVEAATDEAVITLKATAVDEAIRLLSGHHFDVLILDVGSHPASALEVLSRLPALNLVIPVIVVSGEAVKNGAYGDAVVLDGIIGSLDGPTFVRTVRNVIERFSGEAMHVMIVEDDPSSRAVVRQQIAELGLRSVEARDGEEALALMHKQMPDLIVLDVGLPKLDGFALIAALRKEARNIPIVVYTARDLSREDKESLSLGVTRFLTKSQNTVNDLLAAVRELLSGIVAANKKS